MYSSSADASIDGCAPDPATGVKHQINMAEYHLAAADIPAARQWVGDAIAAATARGMKSTLMSALLTSARVAATVGDVGHAHSEVCHALSIGRGIQAALGIAEGFECLGGLAQSAEDHHKAARLLGAADAIRQKAGSKRLLLTRPGSWRFARRWATRRSAGHGTRAPRSPLATP